MMSGLSPSDIAAIQGNNRSGDMFGGAGFGDFILGWIFGGFTGGFNGGFGGGGNSAIQASLTRQDLNDAIDHQSTTMMLNGISNGICTASYENANLVNNALFNLTRTMDRCCCDTQGAIKDLRYENANGFCNVINNANTNTRDIIDAGRNNTQDILNFLVNEKIGALNSENLALKGQISQINQTSNILTAVQAMIDKAVNP